MDADRGRGTAAGARRALRATTCAAPRTLTPVHGGRNPRRRIFRPPCWPERDPRGNLRAARASDEEPSAAAPAPRPMTHDPTTAAPDALQFDHAMPAAGGAAGALTPHSDAVSCSACREPVGEEYWDVGGAHACRRCTDAAAREMRPVREGRVVLRAALFGLGAAIAGAAVYYGVIAITSFEIGIVAILRGG